MSLLKVELDLSDKLLPVQRQYRRKHDIAQSGGVSSNAISNRVGESSYCVSKPMIKLIAKVYLLELGVRSWLC